MCPLANFLWLSDSEFLHYWIAVSLTLIILDFFINTEILSWVAMILFAVWATAWVEPSAAWSILVFILFLAIAIAFYMIVIKGIPKVLANSATKIAPAGMNETLIGMRGPVCGSGENLSVNLNGVIYPIATCFHAKYKAGDVIEVEDFREGMVYPKATSAQLQH